MSAHQTPSHVRPLPRWRVAHGMRDYERRQQDDTVQMLRDRMTGRRPSSASGRRTNAPSGPTHNVGQAPDWT